MVFGYGSVLLHVCIWVHCRFDDLGEASKGDELGWVGE